MPRSRETRASGMVGRNRGRWWWRHQREGHLLSGTPQPGRRGSGQGIEETGGRGYVIAPGCNLPHHDRSRDAEGRPGRPGPIRRSFSERAVQGTERERAQRSAWRRDGALAASRGCPQIPHSSLGPEGPVERRVQGQRLAGLGCPKFSFFLLLPPNRRFPMTSKPS